VSSFQKIKGWRLAVTVPKACVEQVEELFQDPADSVASFVVEGLEQEASSVWMVEGTCVIGGKSDAMPDRGVLARQVETITGQPADLAVEDLPEIDWLAACYQAFQPFSVGRFYIHGSHDRGKTPPGQVGLQIDAATAFGSGEHPTTAGCLKAIEQAFKRRGTGHGTRLKILDIGCGTGVLAMAAAGLLKSRVLASDNDPEAVRVCRENLKQNGLAARVSVRLGGGARPARRDARRIGGYDLITANILARPLMKLAKDIAACLSPAPGSTLVLSGLLAHQAPAVLEAYRMQGLFLHRRICQSGWCALILKRS
jgi:ribosomal protein L11 methyltransferase